MAVVTVSRDDASVFANSERMFNTRTNLNKARLVPWIVGLVFQIWGRYSENSISSTRDMLTSEKPSVDRPCASGGFLPELLCSLPLIPLNGSTESRTRTCSTVEHGRDAVRLLSTRSGFIQMGNRSLVLRHRGDQEDRRGDGSIWLEDEGLSRKMNLPDRLHWSLRTPASAVMPGQEPARRHCLSFSWALKFPRPKRLV